MARYLAMLHNLNGLHRQQREEHDDDELWGNGDFVHRYDDMKSKLAAMEQERDELKQQIERVKELNARVVRKGSV